jgi:ribosomal-protein-alanine N-acetyltransferase
MHIVGQISLGAISYGSMRTAVMGYWVDQRYAGRGITPMAAALLADWALRDASGPRLHRLEIAILPQNERSKRVVNKIGAHYEGVRRRYMFIRGQWRDHETYSLLEDDTVLGFVTDLVSRHAQEESSQKT